MKFTLKNILAYKDIHYIVTLQYILYLKTLKTNMEAIRLFLSEDSHSSKQGFSEICLQEREVKLYKAENYILQKTVILCKCEIVDAQMCSEILL